MKKTVLVKKATKKPPAKQSEVTQPIPAKTDPRRVEIVVKEGQNADVALAKIVLGPHLITGNAVRIFAKGTFGDGVDLSSIMTALADSAALVNANDLKQVEAMLMSQATVLNAMFGELTKRAAVNLNGAGEYMPAMETYFKMAMKAQSQCRQTLETLGNIKNPPVVYAKQANISNGPQQVNNGSLPRAHAAENESGPTKVLEQHNEQRMDTGTQGTPGRSNPEMEALEELNRPQDGRG